MSFLYVCIILGHCSLVFVEDPTEWEKYLTVLTSLISRPYKKIQETGMVEAGGLGLQG